ncbi:TolC family protein [Ferrimonas sediminicola]|uniref:TolC family protein n=1 Tax=Ferrimonas sediminicola TaxID=2569538 RepID=A0A4U1BBR1_9GAMM|nr:TolC family protein [Ferrimonas sediminicola]TKB48381.1 TolC family protein [Ferrimonas sediminicola]
MHLMIRTALMAVTLGTATVAQAELWSDFARQALERLAALPELQAKHAELELANLAAGTADQPLYNPDLSLELESLGADGAKEEITLGLSQTVDWSDKRDYRARLAQLSALQALAEYRQSRNHALARLLIAWVNLDQARSLSRYAGEQQQRTRAMLELAERMVRVGELAPLDRQLITLELARMTGNLADARQQQAQARAEVRLSGGSPDLALPAWSASFPLPSTDVSPQLPALKGAYQGVLAARAGLALARTEAKADPTLSVGAITDGDDTSLQLGISVPLNIRNRYQGEIAQANQAIIVAEKQFLDASRTLAITLESLAERYQAVSRAYQSWQRLTRDSLQSSETLLQTLWREGELPTSQYLQSQQQLTDTRATGAELAAQQRTLWIEMMAQRGELETWLVSQAQAQ